MIETGKKWGAWIAQILLLLGTSFLLTGIIFFFAFNWQNMLSLQKFAVIEISILCCILGALIYKHPNPSAFYLTGASVLVGVFLAVFGQIYQTGADPFQLFAVWAILILPWVFIAQFTPLWFIWLVVLNTALILFLKNTPYANAILIIFNTIVLFIREYRHWLPERWLTIVITLFLLIVAFQPIDDAIAHNTTISYSAVIAALTLGSLIYIYGFHLHNMWVVALTSTEIAILFCDLCMHILINLNVSEVNRYLSMLLITLFTFTFTAYFLIQLGKRQALKGK